jgi:hypothetical protein
LNGLQHLEHTNTHSCIRTRTEPSAKRGIPYQLTIAIHVSGGFVVDLNHGVPLWGQPALRIALAIITLVFMTVPQ